MAFRSVGNPLSFVLRGALVLSLGFAACGSYVPAYAADPDWTSVDIRNGNFATPALTSTTIPKLQVPDFWVTDREDGPGVSLPVIYSVNAGHPKSLQAVELNYVTVSGTTETPVKGTLQTRLWGVRKGTDIEVSYDVSAPNATMIPACSGTAAAKKYKVYSSDSTESQATAIATKDSGWRTDVYKFKASEDNPKLVFTSADDTLTKCGAVIANVSARADRNTFPAPDLSIKRNNLPWHAYQGVKEVAWSVVKDLCKDPSTPSTTVGTTDCIFTVDPSRTYSYFAESRTISPYASLNCTRNPITDSRKTVSWTEEGFDPFHQELNRPKPSVGMKPDNTGSDDYKLPTTPTAASEANRFNAVQAGFQRYEMNTKLANTETPLIPTRDSSQDISIQVQPGEASWIEVQAARERIGGYYSTGMSSGQWAVIDTLLDFPSSKIADRLFQRTGPMTTTEQDHCLTSRPTMPTPDNNGTSAIRPKPTLPTTQSLAGDRNLVSIEATPGDRKTRSILLEP